MSTTILPHHSIPQNLLLSSKFHNCFSRMISTMNFFTEGRSWPVGILESLVGIASYWGLLSLSILWPIWDSDESVIDNWIQFFVCLKDGFNLQESYCCFVLKSRFFVTHTGIPIVSLISSLGLGSSLLCLLLSLCSFCSLFLFLLDFLLMFLELLFSKFLLLFHILFAVFQEMFLFISVNFILMFLLDRVIMDFLFQIKIFPKIM